MNLGEQILRYKNSERQLNRRQFLGRKCSKNHVRKMINVVGGENGSVVIQWSVEGSIYVCVEASKEVKQRKIHRRLVWC